jgi:hypothetical protein
MRILPLAAVPLLCGVYSAFPKGSRVIKDVRASPYPAFPAANPGDRDSCEFFALTRALPRSPRYGRGWDAPAPSDEPEEVDRDEVDTSCNIGAILGLR